MEDISNITWLGHASFFFTDTTSGLVYYIDPFDLKQNSLPKADLIFITHAHYDHLSEEDSMKIIKDDTIIIAPPDCLEKFDLPREQKFPVAPNNTYTVKTVTFQTFPAYNVNPVRLLFHPKLNFWVGYILTINARKIYHPGDTDFTPEMKTLNEQHIDIALLPIGGTYTMDVNEAVDAANAIAAKISIPMHYKRLLGEKYKEAEDKFTIGVNNSRVIILEELH